MAASRLSISNLKPILSEGQAGYALEPSDIRGLSKRKVLQWLVQASAAVYWFVVQLCLSHSLSLSVHVHVCVYIYIHTHTHTRAHTHTHIYMFFTWFNGTSLSLHYHTFRHDSSCLLQVIARIFVIAFSVVFACHYIRERPIVGSINLSNSYGTDN